MKLEMKNLLAIISNVRPSIEINSLNWGIGDQKILQDINVKINAGDKLAILGNLEANQHY